MLKLPLLGPGPLIYRPCTRPCSNGGVTTQALPRPRPSLSLTPPGRHHRRPGYPLWSTKSQLLLDFKGDTLRDINEALECWIRDVYHQRKHLGTGQAFLQRFTSKMECVRPAPADREGYFQKKSHASRGPGPHRLPDRQTIRGSSASDRQANHPPVPRS
ncbi:hypothetical protein DFAR_2730041 [Desulfarculales bacterium]